MADLYDTMGLSPEAYQKLLGRVDLFEETIYLTRYENGAAVSRYELDPAGLATAFLDAPLTTGILPRDTLFYARDGQGERLAVYLPPGRRRMLVRQLEGELQEYEVPLPGLVFGGQSASYYVFAVKQRPGRDDRLYHAPLPNVYSNGAICTGNVDVPACTPATMREAVQAVFESPFNFHLVNRKSASEPDDITALWRTLQERRARKYPVKDLLPTGGTFGDLVAGKR